MKLRNRILSAIMAIAACMTFVGTSAFAADYEWTFAANGVDGKIAAGTEFDVVLDITANAGLIGMNAEVSYDAEGLELMAAPTITTVLGTNSSLTSASNPYVISVGDGLDPVTATGNLATFKFKAVKDGTWNINLVCDAGNTMDGDWGEVDFGSKVVTIEVGENAPAKTPFAYTTDSKANDAVDGFYTQGFKADVTPNDDVVTVAATLANNDKTASVAWDGSFSGATPITFAINVLNVPATETVSATWNIAAAE